jgi:hypothetical protein
MRGENRVKLTVKSTVIYWQESTMEITDMSSGKHTIPIDKRITVTMVGYPAREEKTMLARELGPYMSKGYIIEQIEYEEEE